jgi:hypothetical protein
MVLAVLAAAFAGGLVWFNLRQQLTPGRLAEARRLWEENGPRDYVLHYSVKAESTPDPAGPPPMKYTVRVREGRVVSAEGAGGRPLRGGEYEFGSMDDLFDHIERRLTADREAGGRPPFVTATFHKQDGHVAHYVRSVMKTRERLEVVVQLRRGDP